MSTTRDRRTPAPFKLGVQPTQPSLPCAGGEASTRRGSEDTTVPRKHLVNALRADLVGPYQLEEGAIVEQELLELPPSRYYLTGFLAPEEERDPEDVNQDDELAAGPDEPEEETQNAGEEEPRRRNLWPASIGMSLLVPAESNAVSATVRCAEYVIDPTVVEGRRQASRWWRRKPKQTITVKVPLDPAELEAGIRLPDTVGLVLAGQIRDAEKAHGVRPGTRALALFLVNRRSPGDRGRRDEQFIFQVELEFECCEGVVPRPNSGDEDSDMWDDRVADLQFRERCEYAVGHNIAVEVVSREHPVTRVRTTWLLSHEVRHVVAHHEGGVTVAMDDLAQLADGDDVRRKLARLPEAYGAWIGKQRQRDIGEGGRLETRQELTDKADDARKRVEAGIELLARDTQVRRAFCLANKAMAEAVRHRSPQRYQGDRRPEWRLFEIAFVLMNLNGLSNGQHPDRDRVELIFFPHWWRQDRGVFGSDRLCAGSASATACQASGRCPSSQRAPALHVASTHARSAGSRRYPGLRARIRATPATSRARRHAFHGGPLGWT